MTISFTTAIRNARADLITSNLPATGSLRIYDGTPPASANAALSANNLLANLPLSGTFAAGAASGVLTANAITNANAAATGTASFFRLIKTDGTTVVAQGSVGVSASDLNLNTTAIVSGGPVAVSSLVWTEGNP
jgi:hypothetical protein